MTFRGWRMPLSLSGLFFLSQAHPLPSPVRDAATLLPAEGFHFSFPVPHLLMTPFCSVADLLTVASLHQAYVLAAYVIVISLWLGRKWGPAFLFFFLSFVAWGALVPRPMAKLMADDQKTILIDFHSHTQFSHDGRATFLPQANMRWHHQQGYNAAFITDHNTILGAQIAKTVSRRRWRETGYRSLQGEEVSLQKTHLVILGNHQLVDNRPYDGDYSKIRVFIGDMAKKGYPVIASLPEYWFYHWLPSPRSPLPMEGEGKGEGNVNDFVHWGIKGFEIINSAPKALDFPLEKRLEIVDLCRKNNLFMTGISDNHGYGYATAAWNAIKIPGWQVMAPDTLEKAVLESLAKGRFSAVQVLERDHVLPASSWALALSPLSMLWIYWRSLVPLQIFSWTLWIWVLFVMKSFLHHH